MFNFQNDIYLLKMEIIYNIINFFLKDTTPPPLKRSLKIEKISRADFPSVAKIARQWQKIAVAKEQEARNSWTLSPDQFHNCAWVSTQVANTLAGFGWNEVFVCKDGESRVQGIMITTVLTNGIYVDYLVTHPQNIRSSLNDHEIGRVASAGSSLLQYAEKRAQELNKRSVYMRPLELAKPFYQKMGYKELGGYMIKTIEKVEQISTPLIAAAA